MENLFQYLLNRSPSQLEKEKYRNYDLKLLNQNIVKSTEYSFFMNQNYQKIFDNLRQIFSIQLLDLVNDLQPKTKQVLYHVLRDKKYQINKWRHFILEKKNIFDTLLAKKCRNFFSPLIQNYSKFSKIYIKFLNLLLEKERIVSNLTDIVDICWEELTWDSDFISFVEKYTDKYLCL